MAHTLQQYQGMNRTTKEATMGYENAPSTKMLATHCVCCRRPLRDALSVERGVGPDCWKSYVEKDEPNIDEDARQRGNQLIHEISVMRQTGDMDLFLATVTELSLLGFEKLVGIIEDRATTLKVRTQGDRLVLTAPYDPEAVDAMRRIPGRRWDQREKVNTFPANQKARIWALLKRCYPGHLGKGPKGFFQVAA